MSGQSAATRETVIAQIGVELDALLAEGKPVRRDISDSTRLHIDRPLPFLSVYVGSRDTAAFQAVSASASYLIAQDDAFAWDMVRQVAPRMSGRCGGFLVIDIGELAEDRFLTDDAPYLPPFEIALASGASVEEQAARKRFASAASSREARYRTPRICDLSIDPNNPSLGSQLRCAGMATLTVRFAPIYRAPGNGSIYPALRDLVVANMVDSSLQAISAFLKAIKVEPPKTHRSLGRRVFIETVARADQSLDEVASAFDFLLSVTPINAEPAWQEFRAGGYDRAPKLLYRPLEFEIATQKRKLFSVSMEHLEDPLLAELLLEKQMELDLQLSMLGARETPRFVELGTALYGRVEASLARNARDIIDKVPPEATATTQGSLLGAEAIASAAREMIARYRAASPDFDASVEIRADLPAGLLVSRNRLLISRNTMLAPERLTALLSHEVGVHLLTYFNGDMQGLFILRSGLAGYEGMQEGLAVLAEYLAGGMNSARLRLIAARVLACQALTAGATFGETFGILHKDLGMDGQSAFNVVLRVFRGGGLVKDAIYLRGVMQVLDHLKAGGSLTPFWIGKISAAHFTAIEELSARGLLKAPRLEPDFLTSASARPRLRRAMAGMTAIDMIASDGAP